MRISKRDMSLFIAFFTVLFVIFTGLSLGSFAINGIIESNQPSTDITVYHGYSDQLSPSYAMVQNFTTQNGQLQSTILSNETINATASFSFALNNSEPGFRVLLDYRVFLPATCYLFLTINHHVISITTLDQSGSGTIDLNSYDSYLVKPGINKVEACVYNDSRAPISIWDPTPQEQSINIGAAVRYSYSTKEIITARNDACFLPVTRDGFTNITVILPPGTTSVTVLKFPENKAFTNYLIENGMLIFAASLPASRYQIKFL